MTKPLMQQSEATGTALMEYRGLSADEAERIRDMIDAAESRSTTKKSSKATRKPPKKRGDRS